MSKMTFPVSAVLLIAAAVFFLISCQALQEDPGSPSLRGLVKGLSASQGDSDIIGFVQIEGALEADTAYDHALVTATRNTKIQRRQDGKNVKAGFADLQQGMLAEVWFTGPVAESDPVQATASIIVILSDR